MKKTIVVMIALAAFAGTAFAKDIEEFAAPKQGKVSFPHKVHQILLKNCKECHKDPSPPGKIQSFGQEWAHTTCKGCHVKKGKGPTACNDCHKK